MWKTQESVSELHGRKKLEDVYYGSGKTYQLRAIYAMILLSYISEYLVFESLRGAQDSPCEIIGTVNDYFCVNSIQ